MKKMKRVGHILKHEFESIRRKEQRIEHRKVHEESERIIAHDMKVHGHYTGGIGMKSDLKGRKK